MVAKTTYANFRENLDTVLDRVADEGQVVVVRRKGSKDVAVVPAEDLAGLVETAYLLRSPANARRLRSAARRAKRREAKR